MNSLPPWVHLTLVFIVGALLAGCEGAGEEPNDSTLRVSLAAAPACGLDAVHLTVTGVRVNSSSSAEPGDEGWHDIVVDPPRTINLLDLPPGIGEPLGQIALPSGPYTQVRLLLDTDTSDGRMPNTVRPAGSGADVELQVPASLQPGIRVLGNVESPERELADVTLDFDTCRSILQTGDRQYRLQPAVRLVANRISGSISGVLDPGLAGSSPVIFAQQNGTVIQTTLPDDASGAFTLGLLPASEVGYDVVVTARGYAASLITRVPVSALTDTPVSTAGEPLLLGLADEGRIRGTVLPQIAGQPATVTATQTVVGHRLTLAHAATRPADAGWQLQLPLTAPWVAPFGALPLNFQPQASGDGVYVITASLPDHVAQTAVIDLTGGDLTLDFSLD